MRALLTTALALAFLLMAAITYLAVTQDPLAGEPRAAVDVAPPDLAKLQPKLAPAPLSAPVAAAPAPAPVEASNANTLASTEAVPDAVPAPAALSAAKSAVTKGDFPRAAEHAGIPMPPVAAANPASAAQPDPIADNSVEGASVVLPQ